MADFSKIPLPAKYRRCFYEMAKEVFHYGKERKVTYEQFLQVIFFFSSFRILYTAYLMATGYPSWNPYQHDVFTSFLRLNGHRFDYTLPVAIYFFNIAYTALEYWVFRMDVQKVPVWKWWWQILVLNQDQYYSSLFSNLEQKAIKIVKTKKISGKITEKFPLIPEVLLEPLASLLADWKIFYNLENADIKALAYGSLSLPIKPQLSWTLRQRSLLILLITDYLAFGFQLFVGNFFCFNFFKFKFFY